MIGVDACQGMVNICRGKQLKACQEDCRFLSQFNDTFDFAICIAVLHHIYEDFHRVQALHEMARILQPGGRGMFTVWSYEENCHRFTPGDNLVKWVKGDQEYFHSGQGA